MHYYGISDEAVVQGSDNAMAVSAFHACVRAISDAVSGLPWNVYKRDDDGKSRKAARSNQDFSREEILNLAVTALRAD